MEPRNFLLRGLVHNCKNYVGMYHLIILFFNIKLITKLSFQTFVINNKLSLKLFNLLEAK